MKGLRPHDYFNIAPNTYNLSIQHEMIEAKEEGGKKKGKNKKLKDRPLEDEVK